MLSPYSCPSPPFLALSLKQARGSMVCSMICSMVCSTSQTINHGLLYGLLYGLLRSLLRGLLYGMLYGLLYGLLCGVLHTSSLLMTLTIRSEPKLSPKTSARAQKRAAVVCSVVCSNRPDIPWAYTRRLSRTPRAAIAIGRRSGRSPPVRVLRLACVAPGDAVRWPPRPARHAPAQACACGGVPPRRAQSAQIVFCPFGKRLSNHKGIAYKFISALIKSFYKRFISESTLYKRFISWLIKRL